MSDRGAQRAGDTDRQVVADRLRRAHDEGRLGFAEYDDRLGRAYAAVTYADLDGLVADLPAVPPRPDPAPPAPRGRSGFSALATVWTCVLGVNLLVWTLVSLGNGRPDYFWPMWLFVPAAVVLLPSAVARLLRR